MCFSLKMIFSQTVYSYLKDLYVDRLDFLPPNLKISLQLIIICLVFTLFLYAYIALRRIKQGIKRRAEQRWDNIISNMLANLIVYDDEDDNTDDIVNHFYPRLKKLPLKNKLVVNLLIHKILDYSRNFTGKTADVLNALFIKLHLDKEVMKKILSRHWEVKIEGIREASKMGLADFIPEILKYVDDENAQLRMEAQIAYVKLSPDNHFKFLDRANEYILEWHQLVLYDVITKYKGFEIPKFAQWLKSPNDTVVMFCLKLVEFYMQFDAENDLLELLHHRNPYIVKKSIEILGKLELQSAEKQLFDIYFNQPLENKLAILKALGRISSGNFTEFLSSRIYSDEFKIKMEGLKALKELPEKGILIIDELFKNASAQNQSIIKHILDERIKD